MEFFDLGENCAKCNQRDYLAFKCDLCKKPYCLEHRMYESHQCPDYQLQQRRKLECPLCQQKILVIEGQDPNLVIERHIQRGCPKEETIKKIKCDVKSCEEFMVVICKDCKRNLCLTHRYDVDHKCEFIKKPKESKRKIDKTKISKSKPIGQSSIELQDRYHLNIFFPQKYSKDPICMFFNKRWKVGKVLDLICNQADVKNVNLSTTNPEEKLNIFDVNTGEALPFDKSLEELKTLKKYDIVVLEYGTKSFLEGTKNTPIVL